eukprot:6455504-Amphidinium_carterae.1
MAAAAAMPRAGGIPLSRSGKGHLKYFSRSVQLDAKGLTTRRPSQRWGDRELVWPCQAPSKILPPHYTITHTHRFQDFPHRRAGQAQGQSMDVPLMFRRSILRGQLTPNAKPVLR